MSKVTEKKIWAVGDRCQIITPKKYSGEKGYVSGFHTDDSPEIWVKLDDHDLQIRVLPEGIKSSEETEVLISPAASKTKKSKVSDCWYTPPQIIDLVQKCLNDITLDPCSDDGKHIEACQHFTASDDGLSQQWAGRVFMNPPYSCPSVWIAKLQEEFNCGRVEEAIALVPVATDTKWFHPLISSNLICFWKGRIKFLDVEYQPKMAARQSHCLIYWGKNLSKFREVFSPFGSFNLLEERGNNLYSLGSKVTVNNPQKYYSDWDWGIITGLTVKDGKIDVKMGDRFIIAVDITDLFLEEEGATECSNSHSLTSAQELVQDSVMQACNSDLNLQQSQKLTNTVQVSSNCDIPTYTTTETCEIYQDLQNAELGIICTQEDSTLLQLPHPAPHSPQKDNDLEAQTSVIASPVSSEPLENYSQGLQPLKMSQDSLPAPIIQGSPQAHISEEWSEPLTFSGTMRNGLLSEAATLPAPTLEIEYCWLRSPGALSLSGKGRPPGQTKQEAELKKLGLINKGEVLNPAILCQWYEIPETWLDPLECRAATELLESSEQQQEIFSILESQRSPLTESSTSTPCVENQQPLTRANAKAGTYIINQSQSLGIIKDNLGFGFTVNWLDSSELITYNWERDDQQIIGFAIAPQHLIDKFFSQGETLKAIEDNHPQLCTKCLKVVERDYTCEKCPPMQRTHQLNDVNCLSCKSPLIKLDDGCGVCGWTPENFLEETERREEAVQKPKGRQRKGCLYRYIENKKLKSGSIVSYPRVIGHRHPDNPTHWRWGFNWEEKVDGEWKGRSIGSVPVGAIALIQSMQNEGVPLEEIIGFIRRAKAKK